MAYNIPYSNSQAAIAMGERLLTILKNSAWHRHQSRRFEKALRLLPPCLFNAGARWADLGCGDGIFTAALYALLGPDVEILAVDHNANALQHMQDHLHRLYPGSEIHPILSDFTLPLKMPVLDGIIIANAFHFVPAPKRIATFASWMKWLKSGARLVMVEYNTSRANPAVPYPIPDSEFIRLADHAGFKKIRIAAKTSSTFLGEMYAGLAFTP